MENRGANRHQNLKALMMTTGAGQRARFSMTDWNVRSLADGIACRSCVRDTQRHRNRMERAGHVQTGAKGPEITTKQNQALCTGFRVQRGCKQATGVRDTRIAAGSAGPKGVQGTHRGSGIGSATACAASARRVTQGATQTKHGTAKASDSRSHCEHQ